jgi:hypothetical protein
VKPLSQRLSSVELKTWLEKETGSILNPVQNQAQKHRDDVRNSIQNLIEASKMLLENSQKEIDKKTKAFNRARALNKIAGIFLERLKKLKPPEQISYDNLSMFASETQKTMVVFEVDVRNWFPRISPFFIMDRRKFLVVFEKSKLTVNFLTDFINKDYIKSKTLEKTFDLIVEFQSLERQTNEITTAEANLKNERLLLENEIGQLETQINQLKSKTALEQLSKLNAEQETLNSELKQAIRHLQKPLLKMQALATYGGGGGITPDELKMIGLYMDNPFEAIAFEQQDCPILKSILEKMSRMLAEDKLKIKDDKQRKAEQAVNEILNADALADLRIKSVQVAISKKALLESPELEQAKLSLSSLGQQMEMMSVRRSNLEADERVKGNQRNEVLEKITTLKKTIQSNIINSTGKQVQL